MPVNRGFDLEALLAAVPAVPAAVRQRMIFEYVLLDGVNDSPEDAQRLAQLLRAPGQGEPDPVQRLGGLEPSPAAAGAHPGLPGDPPRRRPHHDRPVEQGRGHRRRLRPAEGAGGRMTPAPTVAFATLGCRLNQVDTQPGAGAAGGRGFRTVPFEHAAPMYVVNTCTVTARADFSDRQAIRRARADIPTPVVVVTGCYAQTEPAAWRVSAAWIWSSATPTSTRLPDLLTTLLTTERGAPARPGRRRRVRRGSCRCSRLAAASTGRTRAFVKIQDGCQHRCAFCIVPARAGRQPQPGPPRPSSSRSTARRGRPSGDRAHRRGPRPLRRATSRRASSLAALLERLVEVRGCAGCACPPCCPRTSQRS